MAKFNNQIIHRAIDKVPVNENILDVFFREIYYRGGFIAGGFARYVVSETPFSEPGDIDVFCRTIDSFMNLKTFFSSFCKVEHNSDFAISFKAESNYKYIKKKIQLIVPREEGNIKTFGTPDEVIANFDFTINMIAFDDGGFYMAERFESHNLRHKLIFNNIHCPVGILARVRKYLRKGYRITVTEMLKMYYDWDAADPKMKELVRNTFNDDWFDDEDDEETINEKYQNSIANNAEMFKIFYID